jgi:glutamate--cysteine ligase catalytic subunit
MNHYISDHPNFGGDKLNDGCKYKINEEWFQKLKEADMSDRLAYHFASLFNHDSLVIFKDRVKNAMDVTEHFENFNSTNWNSVRFKPPPALDSSIGWRVEFRTLDIQITDFENAAYITLLNLTTRVLNDFDINLSLPISM